MTVPVCGAQHPERPGVLCDKADPCTGYHANAREHVLWGVQEMPVVTPLPSTARRRYRDRGPGRGALAEMANRASRSDLT